MKKNFKRWLALLLAIIMVSGTFLSHTENFLLATGEQAPVTMPENEATVASEMGGQPTEQTVQQPQPVQETQEVILPTQEVTPPPAEPTQAPETETPPAEPTQAPEAETPPAEPTQAPETETPPAEPTQTPETETPPAEPTPETETPPAEPTQEPEDKVEKTFHVTFAEPTPNGGTLRVWAEGENKADVAYTNGSYVKEVKEGTTLYFEIQTKDNYKIDQIKDEDETVFNPISVNGTISTYKMTVGEDKAITALYKEETPVEEETSKEEIGEYTLYITHILETNIGNFRDVKEVKLTKDDFVNGSYNLLSNAYVREGIEVVSEDQKLTVDSFGENRETDAEIIYKVSEGWKAVKKSGVSFFSVYQGTFDDVEIVPENQMPVKISFIYEDGTLAHTAETVMVTEDNGKYDFHYTVDFLPEGFTIAAESEDTYTVDGKEITATFDANKKESSVQLTFVADTVKYTVVDKYLGVNGADDNEVEREDTTGKVGSLTEVEPLETTGFTALPIEQKEIKADGSTKVIVEYERNEYTVTYDTQGGSYVKAKKGLYEENVNVYKETEGKRELICELEEHTHTNQPSGSGKWNEQKGCWKWSVRQWSWIINCGKAEHKHTDTCYSNTSSWDPIPTRQGYTFAGWYNDAECTEKADQRVTLKDNVTVYAKWVAKEVNYTVAYFIENANDNNYSYLTSSVKTALVGSNVTETAGTPPSGLDRTNFTFESSTSATVKADGSTVITVHYSRNVYTLTSKSTFPIDGKEQKLTLTAKYGATITDLMNKTWNTPTNNEYAWSLTGNNNDKIAVFDTMPSGNKTVYNHEYNSKKKQTLKYWLENYNSSETTTRNGKTYGLYKQITVKFNYLYNDADFYEFPGYTKGDAVFNPSYKWGDKTPENKELKADFYYNANPYKLDLFGYQGVQLSSNDVKLGADIQNYLAEPEAPIENATFTGWYIDPEHTEKYEGDYKMPEGLSLYADWTLPTFEVKYVSGEEVLKTETVKYQEKVENYIPEREGYVFEGWYTDSELTEEFDINAPITKDTTIYAKWSQNKYSTYTVRYVVKEGNAYKDIVDPIIGNGVVGQTMQFKAKAFTEGQYSTYAVDAPNKTLKLQAAASENEVLFIYTAPTDLTYKVQYKYGDTVIKETEPLKAKAAKFNVYPTKDIADELQKNYGYAINETFVSASLVSDNSKNVIVFTLRLEGYTITYEGIENVTGWEGAEGTANPNPAKYTAEDEIQLKNPVKIGYKFLGWECKSGTTVDKGEHNGTNVVIEKGSRGNLTFEATWIRDTSEFKAAIQPYVGTYDGKAHTVNFDTSVLMKGETLVYWNSQSNEWQTEAVTYTDVIDKAKVTVGVLDDKSNEIWRGTSTVTINPRAVTMTSATDSKPYDGTALTNNKVEVSGEGFVEGEGATYTVTGSQTIPGTSKNEFSYTLNEGTKSQNYTITKEAGTLTITEREENEKYKVTVTPNGGNEKYDGTEKSVSGFVGESENGIPVVAENGTTYYVTGLTAGVSGTNAGTYDVTVEGTATVKDAAGNDLTNQFKVNVGEASLVITKRNVTLTSGSAEKEYDGTPLTNSEVAVGEEGFAENEGATYDVTGSQLTVGSSANTFTYKLNENTSADNYTITKSEGTLNVTNRNAKYEIKVTANSDTVPYDGTEHTVSGFETLEFEINKQTYTVSGLTAEASRTDAGETKVGVTGTAVVTDAKGNDVTEQFAVSTEDGTLKVEKRNVILTSASDKKVYDGTPLTNDTVTVSGDGWVKGEEPTYTVSGSQTLVGESDNTFTYTLKEGVNPDNYVVTEKVGTLTVTDRPEAEKYEITVEANSSTGNIYDGTEKTAEGLKTTTFTVNGQTYTVKGLSAKTTETNAGTYGVKVEGKAVVEDVNGNDVTKQFKVNTVDGKLVIAKRAVILTSESESKEYDGTALTNKEVTASGDGFVEGEGATYTVTGSQTIVGNSPNTFTYELNENTRAENYDITTVEGTLSVTDRTQKYAVTVEANSATNLYDGKEHTVSGFKTLTFTMENGTVYTVEGLTAKATGTDAATYTAAVQGTAVVRDTEKHDVTAQFDITTVDGALTINPRAVTMTSATDSKPYDGTALTNNKVEVSGEVFVDGEGATYTVTGSQTIPGTSDNEFSYTLNAGTKPQNYTIKTEFGKLTITDRAENEKYKVTVTPNGGNEKYDGTEKSVSGFVGESENGIPVVAENGTTYYVTGLTAGASGTNAGTYDVTVEGTAKVKDVAGNDLTNQFKVNVGTASLVIDKRNVTLTSASAEKEYDGTPLTNSEVTVGGEGFAENEGAAYDVTGSQLTVGSSANTFTYKLNENTSADNYTITKSEGTLTVKNRNAKYEIKVTANSDTVTYDGTEHTVSGFETLEFKINEQTYTVSELTAEASRTDAGETKVGVTGTAVVTDAKGNDVTEQFAVSTEDGTLKVEKRNVTLTSASDEKVYDGTPLTNGEVTVSGEGFVEGEGATYTVTGSQLTVGNSKNTFTYVLNENTKADNYDITTAEGTLTVTDRPEAEKYEITVEANSSTDNIYDGTAKTAEGLKTTTFTVNNQTYTVEGLSAKTTETNAGTYGVKVEGEAVVKDVNGNDVTKQFKVNKVDGELVIAKKEVTVTADSHTREYGTPNPELTYTVTGMENGEKLEDVTTVPELTTTATITSPKDDYPITFAAKISEADNYKIEYVGGTLTITQNTTAIVITAANDEQVYNGNALTNNDVAVTDGTLVKGDYVALVTMTNTSTITNVGEQANVIENVVIKNEAGEDVTENYSAISYANGTLEVTPADIKVTANDNGKVVGQADPELTYTVTKDSTVTGEKAAFAGNVVRTEGEEVGTYNILAGTLTLIDSGAFLAGNYKLTVVPGTFTIEDTDYTVTKTMTNKGTGEGGRFKANETATFEIKVTNNSKNYAVKNVVVEDVLKGGDGTVTILPGNNYTVEGTKATIAELKAGETVTVKAEYIVTQSDIDKQNKITNMAMAAGEGSTDVEIPTEEKNVDFTSGKTRTNKGTGKDGSFKVGETATFDITVTNTGNVTLSNVKVTEQLAGAKIVAGTGYTVNADGVAVIDTLNVGATVVVKAEYQITQEDVDNGGTSNTVTVEGEGPGTTNPDPEEPETEIPTDDKNPTAVTAKVLTNEGTGENGSFKAGETATFDITVENTGNVTLKDVVVKEQLAGAKIVAGEGYTVSADGIEATIASIKVGETATVKAEYVVTQADVDNGGVKNIATVDIPGETDPQPPTEEIPTDKQNPDMESTKTLTNAGSAEAGKFKVGETAEFDITVTNTGNVTLENVTVTEQLAGAKIVDGEGYTVNADGTAATIETLKVGETVVVKAVYTITQKDVDNGGAANSAAVEGKGPGTTDPDPEKPETEIPTEEQKPDFTSSKKLTNKGTGEEGKFKVGETAEFDITVINTGNVTLENVTVTEQLAGAKIVDGEGYTVNADGTAATIETLKVGETVVVKAVYTITQEDVDNGGAANSVAVEGEGSGETDPDPEEPETEIPTEDPKPDFTSKKELTNEGTGVLGKFKLGEIARFAITVENTGNVTLHNVKVTEQLAGAKIKPGTGYAVNADGTAVIETLNVGEIVTVNAEYTITQEDVDNGGTSNTVAVEGEGPGTTDPEPENPKEEIPTDDKNPTAVTDKVLTNKGTGENGSFKAGETATFDITVKNTGNVTLKDVVVTEKLAGAKIVPGEGYTVEDGLISKATIATIKVGETVTVKAEYVVTQKDVDNGGVSNMVTVDVPGKPEPQNPTEEIPTDPQKPEMKSTKELTNEGTGENGTFKVGETAEFDITVQNTGNVTLNNVTVKEQLAGAKIVEGEGYTVNADGTAATIETLKVGETVVVKAVYIITQEDVDNGGAANSVAVKGEGPGETDPDPEEPKTEIPTEEQKPDFTSSKKLTNKGSGEEGKFKVGETAEFDITVKNTGNVTLNNIVVKEQLAGAKMVDGEGYTVNADGTVTIAVLAVGKTTVIKAEYVITQADIDKGGVTNSVAVEGEGSGETDPDPEEPETEIPTEDPKPDFASSKELVNKGTGKDGSFKVGETAVFAITVENTGNVTLHNVKVTEQLAGAKIKPGTGYAVNADGTAVIETLNVGEIVTVNAEYTITQEDVDNGGTSNTVAVEGEGPGTTDPEPENPKEEIPTDDKKPTAVTDKVLTNKGTGENGSFKAGETATFDITVKNTGNVTLKDVVVTEKLAGAKVVAGEGYTVSADGTKATIATIKVGETATVKAEYVVTQEDVDNGGARNTVTVDIPGETDPQPPTEEIPTDTQKPEMKATKELTNEGTGENGTFKVGETAEFDITVQNTGNVTLNNVTVKEQLAGAKIVEGEGYTVDRDGTATIAVLKVGETVVVKAVYTITQSDVDQGTLSNSVVVEGEGTGEKDPDPEKPTEEIPTDPQDPAMSVVKTVTSLQDVYNVGDTITYQIVVKNTGNVTLHQVVVTDNLQNAAGEVTFEEKDGVTFEGTKAIIDVMNPGETVTLNCSYVVTREDAGADIVNAAIGDSEETDPTDPSTTDPSDVEDLYNLTINYVYADGSAAAESVTAQYLAGETFSYTSPEIDGYTPDYAFIRTGAEGMPARDVVITVTYTADAVVTPIVPIVPTTPDTPNPDTTPDTTVEDTTDDDTAAVPEENAADAEPEETVGGEIETTEDGEVEVVPVIDEEVPLANRDLDDHDCCILHFLLMLAAMVVYAAFTRSMKKRQERIAELAEELETEMLKREQQSAE